MIKKLFYDDVRLPPDASWALAVNNAEAKALLLREKFDIISLDHDIGYQMMCSDCLKEAGITDETTLTEMEQDKSWFEQVVKGCTHTENGTHLAQWMLENLTDWPKLIILHSANQYGRERMFNILWPVMRAKGGSIHAEPFNKQMYDRIKV